MFTQDQALRNVILKPYRKGCGPTFRLVVWDTYQQRFGKSLLGYRLTMREGGKTTVLFEGTDFGCPPMHAIDSDQVVAGIMTFLTLRPGDTDPEYFADYTEAQLDYCSAHAEALSCEVDHRFGS